MPESRHPSSQSVSGGMPSFLTTTVPSYSGRARSLPLIHGPGRRGSSLVNAIGLRKKSELDVQLDGDSDFVHSYCTFDEIKGRVDVKFEKDTTFHELFITFEGASTTYVEKVATTSPTAGRTTGRHTFLKVHQPITSDLLPADRHFVAGQTYSVPFNFVVPDRLLPFVCTHKIENEDFRKEHLQLPPSLGDPNVSGEGHVLMDDMAPDMAKVSYSIRARMTKLNAVGKVMELAEKSVRIRIVPAREEAPPLNVDEIDTDHVLRREKAIRKGLFKIGKIGCLAAETTQPRPFHIPHNCKRTPQPISTVTTVNLRFDPASPDDLPPQLDSMTSKLKVYTFFGAAAYRTIPEVRKFDNWSTLHGIYPQTVPLSSRNLSTVTWVRHDGSERESFSSSDLSRRPSMYSTSSTSSTPDPSYIYQTGSPFYTASVIVPIALPTASNSSHPRVFVPTFHSCIVSRIYTLELNLSYKPPGTTIAGNHIVLKSPIQITAEAGERPEDTLQTNASIATEIEQQFGMYEARQADLARELGLQTESPVYEEIITSTTTPFGGTRHLSLGMPVESSRTSAPEIRASSGAIDNAPPEYNVGSSFNISSSRLGGPRTTSAQQENERADERDFSCAKTATVGEEEVDAEVEHECGEEAEDEEDDAKTVRDVSRRPLLPLD